MQGKHRNYQNLTLLTLEKERIFLIIDQKKVSRAGTVVMWVVLSLHEELLEITLISFLEINIHILPFLCLSVYRIFMYIICMYRI